MIKECDLAIYGRKFWVILNPTYEEIKDRFTIYQDGTNDEYDQFTVTNYNEIVDTKFDGNTVRAADSQTNRKGYLVFIFNDFKSESDLPRLVNTIDHESGHVADFLHEDLGMRSCDTEDNSYLIGYIGEKIMEAILDNKNQTIKQ